MSSFRIVIASVLKPLYEPRMYEKIGISLSEIPNTEVHVIGHGKEDKNHGTAITAHGLGSFPRLTLSRLFAPWKVFFMVLKLKPQVLIACTHELLLPFALYKLLKPSTKLVYDLQENYFLNIVHTQAFPFWLRYPLALFVRLKERLLLPVYSLILSAESCYVQEMPFIKKKALVVANKAVRHLIIRKTPNDKIVLLYSGSISREYGIYDAIKLVEQLHGFNPAFQLHIIGFCADTGEAHRLKAFIQNIPYIKANDFTAPVPHSEILKAIQEADWGLICYKQSMATQDRIPTKLYEYISYHLPVLCTTNSTWNKLIQTYDAGISINYENPHLLELINRLTHPDFYKTNQGTDELVWDNESKALTKSIRYFLD